MTLNECIVRVEKRFPGQTDVKEIVAHVTTLEHRIANEALSRYREAKYNRNFSRYDQDTDGELTLMAPPPYDEMYVHYVLSQIYLAIHEEEHYNNELEITSKILADYKVHLIQTMRPDSPSRRRAR